MIKKMIASKFLIIVLGLICLSLALMSCGSEDKGTTDKKEVPLTTPSENEGKSDSPQPTKPPEIKYLSHSDGSMISQTQILTFKLKENTSGIDSSSLTVSANGSDYRSIAAIVDNEIILTPTADLNWPKCELELKLAVSNNNHQTLTVEYHYTVHPCVNIMALPTAGTAPLNVRFSPDITTGSSIHEYKWDFDGDGEYDVRDVVGGDQWHLYKTPGAYNATLEIVDADGIISTATVSITVNDAPVVINVQATPSNGAAPLKVKFKTRVEGACEINSFEWDFDGDGTYDYSSEKNGWASHTYQKPGTYQPVLKVTDNFGKTHLVVEPSVRIMAGKKGAPSVSLAARKSEGKVPLEVKFHAVSRRSSGTITKWEWDFDGDGAFDQTVTDSESIDYIYEQPGNYNARVRVTGKDNMISEDIIKIVAMPSLSLSLSTDTIDTGKNESLSVATILGGKTQVSLVVENRQHTVVRTLVPWTERSGGTHNDLWAGDDDNGQILPEGAYNIVLLYKVDGKIKRFDPALTTGGEQSNPPRSNIPPNFSPYAGKPLIIDFTLDKASEVTAFIGRFHVNERQKTFCQRKVFGRGTHSIIWDGANSHGKVMNPPGTDSYVFGIFAYSLPDNAVFLRSGAHLSNLNIKPFIFNPSEHTENGTPALSELSFDLSHAADVELTVSDVETGKRLYRQLFPGLPAGNNKITWNGTTGNQLLAAPGKYRLGICAIDQRGNRSMALYGLQRIYY